jgi:hypothetical protein
VRQKIFICFTVRREPQKFENRYLKTNKTGNGVFHNVGRFMGYMQIPFMALCTQVFIMDKCGWNCNWLTIFGRILFSLQHLNKICRTVFGIHGKVHLCSYANYVLLCISMGENPSSLKNLAGSLLYRTLTLSMERLLDTWKNPYIYCHALGDRRRGIGLSTGFLGSRYNYSYRVSQCTPFTTLQ